MECPNCAYALSPFDKSCPRCERMGKPQMRIPASRDQTSSSSASPLPQSADVRPVQLQAQSNPSGSIASGVVVAIISVACFIAITFVICTSAANTPIQATVADLRNNGIRYDKKRVRVEAYIVDTGELNGKKHTVIADVEYGQFRENSPYIFIRPQVHGSRKTFEGVFDAEEYVLHISE